MLLFSRYAILMLTPIFMMLLDDFHVAIDIYACYLFMLISLLFFACHCRPR